VVLFGPAVVKVALFAHSLRPPCPCVFAPGSSEIPGLFFGGCAEVIPADLVGLVGVVLSSSARDVFPGGRGGVFPGDSSGNSDPGAGWRSRPVRAAHPSRVFPTLALPILGLGLVGLGLVGLGLVRLGLVRLGLVGLGLLGSDRLRSDRFG
jgi:hypothetical protein